MSSRRTLRIYFALLSLTICTSCADLENAKNRAVNTLKAASLPQSKTAFWNDRGRSGPAKIVVNLSGQRAFFYKGKTIVGASSISTGKPGYETPPGKYRVIQKDEHHVSSVYGDFVTEDGRIFKANVSSRKDRPPPGTTFVGAKMPYFLRFTRGYGMHAGYVPRYRASHGCIRMPAPMAKRFFNAARLGTPVIVKE